MYFLLLLFILQISQHYYFCFVIILREKKKKKKRERAFTGFDKLKTIETQFLDFFLCLIRVLARKENGKRVEERDLLKGL